MSSSSISGQWLLRGNVVVPTGNPFEHDENEKDTSSSSSSSSSAHRVVLGRGLLLLLDHMVEVQNGIISAVVPAEQYTNTTLREELRLSSRYIELAMDGSEFLTPGLLDLHIHAPQYSYAGTATDLPLMGPKGWLETYTFPAERRMMMSDDENELTLARQVYTKCVQATLRQGTTTALYFATMNLEPTQVLVDIALEHGQRALVGKVCMDRNSPEDYRQTIEQNIHETELLIEYIHARAGNQHETSRSSSSSLLLPLVLPVVTPRFIPTCTPALMEALGKIVKKYQCHVTTHVSESLDEVEFAKNLDLKEDGGGGRTDIEILDFHGLLTRECILAHGIWITDKDYVTLRVRGSSIAHCPLSNFYFANASLPTRKLLEHGNLVGMGTDVAGGYSPSILNACRMAVLASHSRQHCSESPSSSDQVIDYRHAFYIATLGSARAVNLHDRIGTLQVGMEFDALVLSVKESPIDVFDSDTPADIFQKLCTLGDDRNIKRVFVQGRDVTITS